MAGHSVTNPATLLQSSVWRNVAASSPQLELAVLLSVYVEPPHSSYRVCYCHWPPGEYFTLQLEGKEDLGTVMVIKL